MLIEARKYRLAASAFVRNSGSTAQLARATNCTQREVEQLLAGELAFLTAGAANRMERLLPEREREWVRESPRYAVTVGQVPTSLIAPVLQEAFVKLGRTASAKLVDTQERQLYAMQTERGGVRFALADKIVTRLASPSWWLEDSERRRWYFGNSAVFGRSRESQRRAVRSAMRRRRVLVAS